MARIALGLDFGTESVRALAVDCQSGDEVAEEITAYPHGVIDDTLPSNGQSLPPEFALQDSQDYLSCLKQVLAGVLKKIKAEDVVGIGVDFTACTMLPIKENGQPLRDLPEFANNPYAWVKLWKHHAAQPEADKINQVAHQRQEKCLAYYSGIISSEWMLPKCWETLNKAPEVYEAADYFVEAGDWIVQQMTGEHTRNACAAGYKGMWSEEEGFPSEDFLKALDPKLSDLNNKWVQKIVAPGQKAGRVTEAFAELTGLKAGTPVSAATIDAHSGVPGMGVCEEGKLSIIMGTSSCHMLLSKKLALFDGYAGVAKDGILAGFYGYESGQSAVGDIFGWFAKDFMAADGDPFAELSAQASTMSPGESGLLALDWMNGNRSVLMNAHLSGVMVGLTLASKPAEVYRALIEGSAFGTRVILKAYQDAGVAIDELVVCGGLVKDPMIMQIYADVTGLPIKVASSGQAVALGAAIFGSLAAGVEDGGFAEAEDALQQMTSPPSHSYEPNPNHQPIYDQLFEMYLHLHDHFGRDHPQMAQTLKEIKLKAKGH